MTTERTHKPMTNAEIKKTAYKNGYTLKGHWTCDACKEEAGIAMFAIGYSEANFPTWVDVICALKYQKKGSTVAACACGWRKDITIKFKEKRQCTTEGCTVVMNHNDPNSICFLCREAQGVAPAYETNPPKHAVKTSSAPTQPTSTQGQGVGPVKICNRVNCNNPVPQGRTAVCYSCQPPPTEPVSSKIYQ